MKDYELKRNLSPKKKFWEENAKAIDLDLKRKERSPPLRLSKTFNEFSFDAKQPVHKIPRTTKRPHTVQHPQRKRTPTFNRRVSTPQINIEDLKSSTDIVQWDLDSDKTLSSKQKSKKKPQTAATSKRPKKYVAELPLHTTIQPPPGVFYVDQLI